MIKKTVKESPLVVIFRIILGLVFIFSSTVKGIDPLGTAYRVEDYLIVYGMDWMLDWALLLSIILIAVEFLLGFAILFKLKARLAALGILLIMVFFTAVTWFDAQYDLVPDCGCFGDAVKLSNWETFSKNVVLILLAFVVFFKRKTMVSALPQWLQSVTLAFALSLFVWFNFYNFQHLPMMDFRAWKVGNNMKSSGEEKSKIYVTYQNMKTGGEKEYLSPNYPWNDSLWMAEWEFRKQRIDESGLDKKHNLYIEDKEGHDLTKAIIEHEGNQFLLVSYDLDFANGEGMIKAANLFRTLDDQGIAFDMLSASDESLIKKYSEVYQIEYPVYFADDIDLKAMIRSNPGLLWLRDGVIMQKWHHNDFPTAEKLDDLLKN